MSKRIAGGVSGFAQWLLVFVGVAAAGGCSAPIEEETAAVQLADLRPIPPLRLLPLQRVKVARLDVFAFRGLDSQNALPSGRLSNPLWRRQLERLAGDSLVDGAATLRMLPSDLVTYLARCALREGDDLEVSGSRYPGRLGLVPDWTDPARTELSVAERRWMTACLMAHTNDLATVNIAVAGTSAPFRGANDPAAPQWSYEEAAFYGNVFTTNAEMYACLGAASAARCDGGEVAEDIERRICGRDTENCHFKFAGRCSEQCDPLLPHKACQQHAEDEGPVPRSEEVMTVFLRTAGDLRTLHPSCNP